MWVHLPLPLSALQAKSVLVQAVASASSDGRHCGLGWNQTASLAPSLHRKRSSAAKVEEYFLATSVPTSKPES